MGRRKTKAARLLALVEQGGFGDGQHHDADRKHGKQTYAQKTLYDHEFALSRYILKEQ